MPAGCPARRRGAIAPWPPRKPPASPPPRGRSRRAGGSASPARAAIPRARRPRRAPGRHPLRHRSDARLHRAHLDGPADAQRRDALRDRERLVDVAALDDVEAAELLLGLGIGAVGHDALAALDPERLRRRAPRKLLARAVLARPLEVRDPGAVIL